jgi:hypothetical protein
MSGRARPTALARPTPVAVHYDRDVPRHVTDTVVLWPVACGLWPHLARVTLMIASM